MASARPPTGLRDQTTMLLYTMCSCVLRCSLDLLCLSAFDQTAVDSQPRSHYPPKPLAPFTRRIRLAKEIDAEKCARSRGQSFVRRSAKAFVLINQSACRQSPNPPRPDTHYRERGGARRRRGDLPELINLNKLNKNEDTKIVFHKIRSCGFWRPIVLLYPAYERPPIPRERNW